MNLSQQTKPYPRTMYHLAHDKPKVVNSKAEEAEASTKGWIVSYIYKEYPKWVDGKIVRSKEEEERLFADQSIEATPVDLSVEFSASPNTETILPGDLFAGEDPSVTKETQVDGQDTAVIEKPKEGNGRRKKK